VLLSASARGNPPMLPPLNLPVSLLGVLMALRPCFTAPTFTTFCGLVAGLAGQVRRRTVVGMLLGACLQHLWPHDRARYFFSRARWQLDELGLAVARLVAELLIEPGADVIVALDDSVCVRSGPRVHGAGWQHDGSAENLQKLSFGNCFVTVGIVVALPFCSRSWCLPVLARPHLPGKGAGPSRVTVAAELVTLLAAAFPGRRLNVVAGAAYHGPALRALPGNVTRTCRLPRTAVLYGAAPPRTGRRGRPRTRGARLGTPADLARQVTWTTRQVPAYHGRTDIKHIAAVRCLWYGSFHARTVTVVLVRDQRTTSGYDLALVTTGGIAGRQVLSREFPADQRGHGVAGVAQARRAHVRFEDGEQRASVGQQQALAAVEPQQIGVPVLRAGCRAGDRRCPQQRKHLPGAPQDHRPIVCGDRHIRSREQNGSAG